MNNVWKNILTVALTTIIGVVIISSGYYIWHDNEIMKPVQDYLQNHEQIKDYQIKEYDHNLKVDIKLEYSPFLNKVYKDIKSDLQNLQGNKEITIELINRESVNLNHALHHLSYLLKDTTESGKYIETWEQLPKFKDEYQLDHIQVHLLNKDYFVQMKHEDDYLLELIKNSQYQREGELNNVDSD